jgi:sec-independent protein translocase protein TatB
MFDIGWTELLVIGVVALVVVGPKDLPKMFRTVGQFTGKARAMAREFTRAMDAAADESGVKDLRDTVSGRKLREATGLDEVEKELAEFSKVERWNARSEGKVRDVGKPSGVQAAAQDPGAVAQDPLEAQADAAFDEAESAVARLRSERARKQAEASARAQAIRTGAPDAARTAAAPIPAAPAPAPAPAPEPAAEAPAKARKPRAPRKAKPDASGPET